MWAYAFRAPLGAFNFCEKPIFTLKTINRQIFVVCYGFFSFKCLFFHANHLAVDATGGFRECR